MPQAGHRCIGASERDIVQAANDRCITQGDYLAEENFECLPCLRQHKRPHHASSGR